MSSLLCYLLANSRNFAIQKIKNHCDEQENCRVNEFTVYRVKDTEHTKKKISNSKEICNFDDVPHFHFISPITVSPTCTMSPSLTVNFIFGTISAVWLPRLMSPIISPAFTVSPCLTKHSILRARYPAI